MSSDPEQSKKPQDSDFQQQRLKAWQPLLTPKWVIATFVLIGIVFIPIGIAIVVSSNKITEYEIRYDDQGYGGVPNAYPPTCAAAGVLSPPTCQGQAAVPGSSTPGCSIAGIDFQQKYLSTDATVTNTDACSIPITFTLEEDMSAPVYFYYKLTNFYQNHRRYVKSRSDSQLANSAIDTSTCDPWKSDDTVNNKPYYPCGLIAGSFFVDRFSAQIQRPVDASVDPTGFQTVVDGKWWQESSNWQKDGIAWKSDKEDKFRLNQAMYDDDNNYNHNGILGVRLPPVNDEDFIVWMRTAGLPTFKKLYRKINTDLKKGDVVTINVLNYYPVSAFDGTKSFVLSTTSWLGGKNSFLGWAYIVVGIVCFVLAAAFAIKHAVSPRPLGDMRAFNWPATSKQ